MWLGDPHPHGVDRESFENGGRNRTGQALEQIVTAAPGDFGHRIDDLGVVDGVGDYLRGVDEDLVSA